MDAQYQGIRVTVFGDGELFPFLAVPGRGRCARASSRQNGSRWRSRYQDRCARAVSGHGTLKRDARPGGGRMNDADFYIGKPIRSLQTMLRAIAAEDEAIPQVVPDGIYGPVYPEAAVTAFQARSGLPPTGEADQATWNRVVDAYLKLGSFVLPIEALRIRSASRASTPETKTCTSSRFRRCSRLSQPDTVTCPRRQSMARMARRPSPPCGSCKRSAVCPQTAASTRRRGSPLQALRASASGDGDVVRL